MPFGLDVNLRKAKSIFVNNSVDTTITAELSYCALTIIHSLHQIDD